MNARAKAQVYLASTSPARARLLEDGGFHPIVLRQDMDEDQVLHCVTLEKGEPLSPKETVMTLAHRKAASAVDLATDLSGLVIGADTVFELDGATYGKPTDEDSALALLRQFRGNTGSFVPGMHVIHVKDGTNMGERSMVSHSFLTMSSDGTDQELAEYVAKTLYPANGWLPERGELRQPSV